MPDSRTRISILIKTNIGKKQININIERRLKSVAPVIDIFKWQINTVFHAILSRR